MYPREYTGSKFLFLYFQPCWYLHTPDGAKNVKKRKLSLGVLEKYQLNFDTSLRCAIECSRLADFEAKE